MIIYTDDAKYAQKYYTKKLNWTRVYQSSTEPELGGLSRKLLMNDSIYRAKTESRHQNWNYAFITEYAPESQYDAIKEELKRTNLPHGILCIAGQGKNFHGFHTRPWESLEGNLHISVYLSPNEPIQNFGAGFLILSAVSALEAIDSFESLKGKPGIKWVNDILIDNSKICGVIAHTAAQGRNITDAILGIGVNVGTKPRIEGDLFVPQAACMEDFLSADEKCKLKDVYEKLIERLDKNYKLLLSGGYQKLLSAYKERSCIIGRNVSIWSDETDGASKEKLAEGIVKSIGENLELYLDGTPEPVIKGRLVLESF